jgi:hypothetical protein
MRKDGPGSRRGSVIWLGTAARDERAGFGRNGYSKEAK